MIYGDHDRFLAHDPIEHPLALQLGSSDPRELADCARIAKEYGYDEVNLNVGCPSDRVKEGQFGACLMAEPDLVARCVEAMRGCKCSGSTTVGVGLANGGRFGLTLCDKSLDGRLRLADNGLANSAPGSRLLT